MKSRDVVGCLKRLKKKYKFHANELKLLKAIEDCDINSIAYTVDGGFDKKTGEFHSEERPACFKVRIKYKSLDQDEEQSVYLMKIANI